MLCSKRLDKQDGRGTTWCFRVVCRQALPWDYFRVARYSTGAPNALATAHDLSFPFPFEGIVGQDYLGGAWYDSTASTISLIARATS